MKFSAKAKRIVALLIVLFLVLLAFSSIFLNYVSADTESQLKQQQQNLNANKAGIKGEINELNVQKDNVMAEKRELDTQVTSLEGEIDELNV